MANYLGKISAVVVANTTGWQKNLNSAAADLRKFAATVQRDVTKASTDANKAFNSMLTPLQRLERSLKAASAMKLSFRGFDGAMRTVEQLRDRLTRLNQTQVDLVVKASGLKSISQFRDAIQGIDQKTLDFAVRFGGVEKLKEFRRQIESVSQESVGAALFAGRQPGVTNAVERLKELRRTVSELSGKPLQLALKVGGEEKISRIERDAIGLSKRDLSLFVKVGGRENLDRVIEDLETVDNFAIDALVKVRGKEGLDEVIERFSAASPEQINAVIKVLGENDLIAAADKMRALASAGRQVFEPLASVASGLPALGISIEQAFTPGLAAVQSRAAALKSQIDQIGEGGDTSRLRSGFDAAAVSAQRATESFVRLQQVAAAVSGFDPGTSFQFVQPEAASVLARANRLQQEALQLSPSQLRQGNFAFRSSGISAELDELSRLNAAREAIFAAGPSGNTLSQTNAYRESLSAADAAIVTQTQKVSGLLDVWERVTSQVTAAERAAAASAQLNVLSPQDVRSDVAKSLGLGESIESSSRQFDTIGQRIAAVKGQLDQLPGPVRAGFVPAITEAENRLIALKSSADASSEEIEKAANEMRQLEKAVGFAGRVEQFNQQFGNFGQYVQNSRINQFSGELLALQQILGRVGAQAGSATAAAFERLQRAMAASLDPRNLNSEAVVAELNSARQAAIAAASAAGGGSQKGIARTLKRAGDSSRFGVDKASLALQQGAFAIDDFFSATGDISQKIRAVQNNVTQLAFILGGTTGLFVGLGVAIAAQATVALFKWINGGVEAKDRTQALNESLARQKSLVEELKQAFDSLGDSLTRGIFDEATERAREFQRTLQNIQTKAGEQIESAAIVDPAVQQERALQASLKERLGKETDTSQRVILQTDLNASLSREESRIDALRTGALSTSLQDIAEQLDFGARRIAQARANPVVEALGLSSQPRVGIVEGDALQQAIADSSFSDSIFNDFSLTGARDVLVDRQKALRSQLEEARSLAILPEYFDSESGAIRNEIAVIEGVLKQVSFAIGLASVELRQEALSSARGIGESLGRSRDLIAAAGAEFGPLAGQQRALAERFARITQELTSGSSVGADGISGTSDDVKLTKAQIEARQEELDQLRKQSAELESAALSTKAFADALDRVALDLANTVVSEAESAAVKARRDTNRAAAELVSLPGDATPAQRREAERNLRAARAREDDAAQQAESTRRRRLQLESDRRAAEEQFQRNASAGTLGADLQQKVDERDRLRAIQQEGQLTAEQAQKLEELNSQIASAFEQTREAQTLRRTANQIDTEQQQFNIRQEREAELEAQRQQSIERGQDLIKTPQQRAAEQGVAQFDDAVNASLQGIADSFGPLAGLLPQLDDGILSLQELGSLFQQFPSLRQQFEQDLQTARDNIAGNLDTQLQRFDEERTKPSRAAIQAQDVNTQQGRAELNRLLRGDDANRDKPVLEGIKQQVDLLTAIDRRIAEVNQTVGVAGA